MGAVDGEGAGGAQLAVYRTVWRVSCGAFAALVVVAAALLLSGETVLLTVLIAVVASATAASMYSSGDRNGVISSRWTRRQVVTAVTSVCAAASLAVGLADVLGSSVLWLVVLLTAGSPRAVQWYGERLGLGATPRRLDAPQGSTAELCRQWRDSYEALRQAKTDRQRLRIVMDRQHYLDELGRLDPEGLEAWLSSAASAAGDPARFLKNQ